MIKCLREVGNLVLAIKGMNYFLPYWHTFSSANAFDKFCFYVIHGDKTTIWEVRRLVGEVIWFLTQN